MSTQAKSSRIIAGLAWMLVAATSGAALVLTIRSLAWPLTFDTAMTHYVAAHLLAGAVPYRDIFETGFPGLYLIHMGALVVMGPSDAAFRAFDLTILAAIMIGLAVVLRPFGALGMLLGASMFWLCHVAGGPWRAGQRDMIICLPLIWLMAAVLADERQPRRWTIGMAGLALGVAVWIKPHAGLLVALFIPLLRRRDPGERWPASGTAVVGFLLPTSIVVGWLVAIGGLGVFLDFLFGYLLPVYSQLGPGLANVLRQGALMLGGLGLVATISVYALWRGGYLRGPGAMLFAGTAYGVLHYVLQAKGWTYQLYPFVLFGLALGVAGATAILARGRMIPASLIVGLILALVGGMTWKGVQNLDAPWFAEYQALVNDIVRELTPRIQGGRSVQVLDNGNAGANVLWRMKLSSPTRIITDFPLFGRTQRPYEDRLRAEFLDALQNRPPEIVVVLADSSNYRRLQRFTALEELLNARYRLAYEASRYRILSGSPS
jgi:hypothetical protein